MKIIVLGAGTIGICTAWYLLERGHEVTVIDRQPQAAMETSFANAGQISVSYCEPWANKQAPLKVLQWMFNDQAPLLFRPQSPLGEGIHQWLWALRFLGQCNDRAFERNVRQLVALGRYSHRALAALVGSTGIAYQRLERGIAHYFTDARSLEAAARAAQLMQRHGVARRVVSREELLAIEPAFTPFGPHIVGGTYTDSDESGNARQFTQALAQLCQARGAQMLFGQQVVALGVTNNAIQFIATNDYSTWTSGGFDAKTVKKHVADAVVVAAGSYSAPLLRRVGISVPVYPGKGYSATLPLLRPEAAPQVSTIDDACKIAMTRLGDQLRVAGTIELAGFDLALDTPLARARCAALTRRVEEVLPGVCDTRTPEEGGQPQFWCGLRPATPTNIPLIGQTPIQGLWLNAGHGTLGWTHGAGSGLALAELINGEKPAMDFKFYGEL